MPNWVATILTVTGDNVEAFIGAVKGEQNLDFEALVPMPVEETKNWYKWSIKNWGTKWNASHVGNWEIEGNQAKLRYNTAWSVATPFFLSVSKLYPNLQFKQIFADEGGDFIGKQIICNGEKIKDNDYGWNSVKGVKIRKLIGYFWEDDEDYDNDHGNEVKR